VTVGAAERGAERGDPVPGCSSLEIGEDVGGGDSECAPCSRPLQLGGEDAGMPPTHLAERAHRRQPCPEGDAQQVEHVGELRLDPRGASSRPPCQPRRRGEVPGGRCRHQHEQAGSTGRRPRERQHEHQRDDRTGRAKQREVRAGDGDSGGVQPRLHVGRDRARAAPPQPGREAPAVPPPPRAPSPAGDHVGRADRPERGRGGGEHRRAGHDPRPRCGAPPTAPGGVGHGRLIAPS
jgi:hypothetical protein